MTDMNFQAYANMKIYDLYLGKIFEDCGMEPFKIVWHYQRGTLRNSSTEICRIRVENSTLDVASRNVNFPSLRGSNEVGAVRAQAHLDVNGQIDAASVCQ